MSTRRFQAVEAAWEAAFAEMCEGEFMRLVLAGRVTRGMYTGFLRETYHNTSLNPRLGSLFHCRLESRNPALEARFLKHNASEMGHHTLALRDLEILGEDIEAVKAGRPLPETEALAAFVAFQIQFREPLSYLGYLYHLESIAIVQGGKSMSALSGLGIPAAATRFLSEHAEADEAHMRLNRDYLEGLVRTDAELDAVIWGLRGACRLHSRVFQAILEADRKTTAGWAPAGVAKPAEA